MEDIEIWKTYAKDPTIEVSNLGRVRTVGMRKYLKICTAGCKYPVVWLLRYKTGAVRKSVLLHRMLAETHLPNPENKPYINHINGNKHDYSLSNLEWCTMQENAKHAYATGLNTVPGLKGEDHAMAKLNANDIIDILKMKKICDFDYTLIGRFYNVDSSMIENICRGKNWKEQYKMFCELYNNSQPLFLRKVYNKKAS